jgi:mannose-6-phosphate isomerase
MKKEVRPWGDFKQFAFNEKCTVKILSVKPHGVLSLQKHKNRKEMWYFLTDGWAHLGNGIKKYKKGESITIGKGVKHRLFSKGLKVEVLEVSYGKFDEKDEVRLDDKYGRR